MNIEQKGTDHHDCRAFLCGMGNVSVLIDDDCVAVSASLQIASHGLKSYTEALC